MKGCQEYKMKSDTDPSLILGLYSTPEAYQEFLKQCRDRNMNVREIHLVDVTIPLDDRYNETINFFKHFTMKEYWVGRNPLMTFEGEVKFMGMSIDIKKKLLDKLEKNGGFKMCDFRNTEWKNDRSHNLLWVLPVPLFVQDQTANCTTDQERENMKRLFKFESDGYINDVDKEEDVFLKQFDDEAEKLE